MTYGKVIVTNNRGFYAIRIGVGDSGYLERIADCKADAYSDAKFLRSMVKRGHHPSDIVQRLGYTLKKE